jgi:hypothetical protein
MCLAHMPVQLQIDNLQSISLCSPPCIAIPYFALELNRPVLVLQESKAWPILGNVSKQISRRTAYHESLTYQDPNKIHSSKLFVEPAQD